MSFLRPLATDAGTTADNLERAERATARLAVAQERVAAAVEKASRAPAPPPGGGLVNAAGQPISTGGGGGAGSSRGGGGTPLGGGQWVEEFAADGSIHVRQIGPNQLAAIRAMGGVFTTSSGILGSDRFSRVSGHGAGGGGGGGGGGRITHMDQLGNYNTAAVRAGATAVSLGAGPGDNKLTRGEALITEELRGLRSDFRSAFRSDHGASLRREGVF